MATHTLITGDGTICLVVDGVHYTVNVTHPEYNRIRGLVKDGKCTADTIRGLLSIPDRINHLFDGKVRVDLEEGKIWYNDTEFHDAAFCERILRLMSEGQDVQYLVNFLNNLGQNPEFRAIMETFKFICNEGMPITQDGCFLAYKGVQDNYLDEYSGTINNTPDGRRVDYDRTKVDNNPSVSCGRGLHVGSYNYAKEWGARVVLVKVNPRDVVSVPNHECEKMRVCGYWVIKDFGDGTKDKSSVYESRGVLTGEVYDPNGVRVSGATYGQFDNEIGEHWNDEGHDHGAYDVPEDDDYDDYDEWDNDDYDDDEYDELPF
jgi:hypothetical protein